MNVEALDYDLPEDRIAQRPCAERDGSRLFVLRRSQPGPSEHAVFRDLDRFLDPGDLLVLNERRDRTRQRATPLEDPAIEFPRISVSPPPTQTTSAFCGSTEIAPIVPPK